MLLASALISLSLLYRAHVIRGDAVPVVRVVVPPGATAIGDVAYVVRIIAVRRPYSAQPISLCFSVSDFFHARSSDLVLSSCAVHVAILMRFFGLLVVSI